jgi:hypothetical protein
VLPGTVPFSVLPGPAWTFGFPVGVADEGESSVVELVGEESVVVAVVVDGEASDVLVVNPRIGSNGFVVSD